jgi:hypothetical protein
MALELNQTLTEMSTCNLPENKARPALKADRLTDIKKMWDPLQPTTQ